MDGNNSQLTFLDLFCGCDGFSLGMERAGFRCLATIAARLRKDGLMFLHPTQYRSLTRRFYLAYHASAKLQPLVGERHCKGNCPRRSQS